MTSGSKPIDNRVLPFALPPIVIEPPPPPFSPLDYDPVAWYDASDAATVTESSGSVSAISNKAPGTRTLTQPTSGNQPQYTTAGINGLNVLDWGSSASNNRFMTYSTGDVPAAEIFVVGQFNTAGSVFPDYNGLVTSSGEGYLIGNAGGEGIYFTNYEVYLNGGVSNRSSDLFPEIKSPFLIRAVRIPAVSPQSLVLGVDRGFTGMNRSWIGYMGEIIIYPSTLGTDARTAITDYLMAKWGIA
jgi:hypothetical protein